MNHYTEMKDMDSIAYKPSKKTQQLWRVELELADILLDICTKNDLTIWAGYGTLIGAARHQGFIPWDDDLDFVMMRSDYDKLLDLVKSNNLSLPINCEFDLADISVIKLRRIDTTMYSKSYRVSNDLKHGVWVDVFCLDVAPDNLTETSIRYYESLKTNIRIHHNVSLGYYAHVKTIKYVFGHFVLRTLSLFRRLSSLRENIEGSLRSDKEKYSGNKVWGFLIWAPIKKDIRRIAIHDVSSYGDTVMMPFEDRMFPCPKDYDSLLTAQYGDWRTPVMGGSQHEGSYADLNKPYKEFIEEKLKAMPWWKRYWYKH